MCILFSKKKHIQQHSFEKYLIDDLKGPCQIIASQSRKQEVNLNCSAGSLNDFAEMSEQLVILSITRTLSAINGRH